MQKLRAAVVGMGFVGRSHLDALRRLAIPVAGTLGSTPERTHETADAHQLQRAYTSIDELAADSAVDVVHLCTPNHLHFEQADVLLNSGKHVVCEKPLAMDAQQSRRLIEVAQENARVGAVAYNLRYYPLCQQARAMIAGGAIGEPRLVHGSFLQDWLFHRTDWNWRLEPQLGGELRAISDIGTHWLDLISWLTQRQLVELCADLATIIPVRERPRGRLETFQRGQATKADPVEIRTDDYGSVLLHYEGGLHGVMTVSQVSAGRKARLWFEIDGSEGSLAWNSEEPNQLWLGKRDEANRCLIKDPALMSPEARGYALLPGGHTEGYGDTFVQLFRDVYTYVAAGDFAAPRSFPTLETGHEQMILCDAIARSARERQWVCVKPARNARA
ncbi:MAG TPA: Gfo/Idh/MocA family oxidoreductase [Terriglobales bacterium]|nr:Gfo/Idh/MocA family oxidoreductase [Terriglobales bacterium]